jgi:type VI secretion system secreted protein VgrG
MTECYSELRYFLTVDGGPSTDSSVYPTLVKEFEITEGLSQLFDISVVVEQAGGDVRIDQVMRKEATFTLVGGGGTERYFHGIVIAAEELEEVSDRVPYRLRIAPRMWVMKHTRGSRVFQDMTVVEVIETVLSDYGIHGDDRLKVLPVSDDYPKLDYCVQYEESAYDFVRRLMEETGIFFWFEHESDKHILVIGPRIFRFSPTERVRSGKAFLLDHSYKPLEVQAQSFDGGSDSDLETYEQLGGYLEVTDANRGDADSAWDRLAEIRHQENQVRRSTIAGESTVFMMFPGGRFEVDFYSGYSNNDIDEDTKYITLRVKHRGARVDSGAGGSSDLPQYSNHYVLMSSETAYRPPRKTAVPRISGVQTALVTGADGATSAPSGGPEIEVDELGRVKVQFHWDRRGLSGFPAVQNPTSCWMRVGQAWAGAGFGQVFIPRIGMEVIVQFVNGDPNRPMITGCVYNGSTPLPLSLPSEKAHTVLRTESTPGGGGFNELRFQDEQGEERIYVHAQKDMDEDILHNHTQTVHCARTRYVGDKESVTVKDDQSILVEEGDRLVTVAEGNLTTHVVLGTNTRMVKEDEMIVVESGNQSLDVAEGSQSVHIQSGQSVNISGGGQSTTIDAGGQSTTIDAGGQSTTVTDGGQSTTITAGGQSTTITAGGQSTVIDAGGQSTTVTAGGQLTTVTADGQITNVNSGDRVVNVAGGEQIMNVTAGGHTLKVSGLITITTDAGAFIAIDGTTISLDGVDVIVNASGDASVLAGGDCTIDAGGNCNVSASGDVNVDGSTIKLNC